MRHSASASAGRRPPAWSPPWREESLREIHEEHGAFRIRTERLDPPRYAAFRWIGREDEKGAGTLTEFWVEDAADGVTLRVVESGLENVPESEREAYLRDNIRGWETELAAARTAAEHGD